MRMRYIAGYINDAKGLPTKIRLLNQRTLERFDFEMTPDSDEQHYQVSGLPEGLYTAHIELVDPRPRAMNEALQIWSDFGPALWNIKPVEIRGRA